MNSDSTQIPKIKPAPSLNPTFATRHHPYMSHACIINYYFFYLLPVNLDIQYFLQGEQQPKKMLKKIKIKARKVQMPIPR